MQTVDPRPLFSHGGVPVMEKSKRFGYVLFVVLLLDRKDVCREAQYRLLSVCASRSLKLRRFICY